MRSLEDLTKYLKDKEGLPAQTAKPAGPAAVTVDKRDTLRDIPESRIESRQFLLAGAGEPEVAQHSYKGFKESREEFLRRLLDPPLTLEEAARVLNVCPTTVRRYTNRGLLKHFRTAGNQRRFRLSHVFAFMEEHMGGAGSLDGKD
jgi:excisionase family DNA binding protein